MRESLTEVTTEFDKVNLRIEIRRNEDGQLAEQVWRGKLWSSDCIWSEGNFSCDCNRELFFCRALNMNEPEEIECGDSRYAVRISNDVTGEVLYDEFEVDDA